MNINKTKEPFGYVVIDNFYDEKELSLIWDELKFLTPKLLPPALSGSATNKNKEFLKTNLGILLDEVYSSREYSSILNINRKIFDPLVVKAISDLGDPYTLINLTNSDRTVINYYTDKTEYLPHQDSAVFTAVTFLFKEPKGFDGGEFMFSDHEIEISPVNNRVVIFNSSVKHSVKPIKMNTKEDFYGRYSIAQLIGINV